MHLLDIILIAIALAMDCFAVSVATGVSYPNESKFWRVARMGLFFGLFQAAMPMIGWMISASFADYIETYAHWFSLVILTILGLKMIVGSFKKDSKEGKQSPLSSYNMLVVYAFATSIDALATGLVFVSCDLHSISAAVVMIGIASFVLTILGAYVGRYFGRRFKFNAELVGGIILIAIGLKIFIETY